MSTKENIFGYEANKILPAVAAAVVGVSMIGHAYQNYHYKFWRITFFMFYGGLFYVIGWILRSLSTHNPSSIALFILQSIFLYLAPPVFSAAEYNILGRLMHYLPQHAIINPNRVVYIFLFLGTIVETLTALGASWMAAGQGKQDKDTLLLGATCIAISVVLQGVVELVFLLTTAHLHYRCSRSKMLPRNVRTLFIMLYGTSILMLLRCIFRSVESFQLRDVLSQNGNSDAALLRHEWPLYVFETLPVILYTFWLNIIHPGRFIPHDQRQYLDSDGKTERMGPGWIFKRPWVMYVADPLNFIGMLVMKKRDKFYLEPERWPEVKNCFAQGRGKNYGPGEEAPAGRPSVDEAASLQPFIIEPSRP